MEKVTNTCASKCHNPHRHQVDDVRLLRGELFQPHIKDGDKQQRSKCKEITWKTWHLPQSAKTCESTSHASLGFFTYTFKYKACSYVMVLVAIYYIIDQQCIFSDVYLFICSTCTSLGAVFRQCYSSASDKWCSCQPSPPVFPQATGVLRSIILLPHLFVQNVCLL